ncbi:unnamed protein product [Blepharisma stoltei]|uniref:PX domain-containing protein n=1 Tax=Blepharisma stoltei TaxID=1481888 RepID=A0AAU9JQ81_9CILI|nr:unnamed protein product [Blepharisma stoltei]
MLNSKEDITTYKSIPKRSRTQVFQPIALDLEIEHSDLSSSDLDSSPTTPDKAQKQLFPTQNNKSHEPNSQLAFPQESLKVTRWEDVDLIHTAKNTNEIDLPELYFSRHYDPKNEDTAASLIGESSKWVIDVDFPQMIKSGWIGWKSYYLYTITSQLLGEVFKVKRRFRHLEWLRNILLKTYPGINIPPLPEKQVFGNTTSNFLEKRRENMKKYLIILAKHPVLMNSEAFKLFLKCKDENFSSESQRLEDSSHVYHFDFLNLQDTIDKIKTKFENLFTSKITPVSQDLVNIDRELNYIEPYIKDLDFAFGGWIKAQNDSQKNFEAFNFNENPRFNQILEESHSFQVNFFAKLNNLSLEIKEEQMKIIGMQTALDSYKSLLKDYSEVESLIMKKIERSATDEDSSGRYIKEIEELKIQTNEMAERLGKIENTIKNEFVWYGKEREVHFQDSLIGIIESQRKRYKTESDFWLEKKHQVLKW